MANNPSSSNQSHSDTPTQSRTVPDAFVTTRWSLILQAGHSQSFQSRDALENLCRTYWRPLYAFARRSGQNEEDAKDATQGFFSHLLSHNAFQVADPARGRFRSFLLRAFKNYIHSEWTRARAQKRGGGQPAFSLNATDDDQRESWDLPAEIASPEQAFDLQWARTTFENGIKNLKQRYADEGKSSLYSHLQPLLLGGTTHDHSRIASELNMTPGAVATALTRLRQRLFQSLREEVEQTVSEFEDAQAEVQYLMQLLAAGGSLAGPSAAGPKKNSTSV